MYQNILSHIAFFFKLFEGYRCNKTLWSVHFGVVVVELIVIADVNL